MNILTTILNKIIPSLSAAPNAAAQPASPLAASVDVEEILRGLESKTSQKLDWRHSIVDLMKMLNMESDLNSRKQLAKELNYSGDTNDSAKMNIWLHAEVMKKLEQNGGKIPDSMKH
jgi:Domain of unknown function (DUF3597)